VPILIVDDEGAHMQALCDTLELEGFAPQGFTSGPEALAALRATSFDLLLTDLMMPAMDGITLLRAAQEVNPDIAAIVMTGHAAIDTAVEAIRSGASDYIVKPFRKNQLLPVIARALETQRLRRLNRELENRVRQRTRELEISNRDLEAFSYTVSHDLRAPLRAIHGFCQLFMTDYGATVPQEGQELLRYALSGTESLSRMIEALLSFARYGRDPLRVIKFSMQALVGEIVGELQRQLPERSIDFKVQPLPECWADPVLVRQVLTNLLSNACKFTAGVERAHIEVRCEKLDGQSVYVIKDNGAGFDMKYAAKLFGVFQRLHSQRDFQGTGIGLAIVQRIVERHGGKAWAEGAPGEGATFRFSLPVPG
jgi:two-component system, sensor histidine kinase and response regulator